MYEKNNYMSVYIVSCYCKYKIGYIYKIVVKKMNESISKPHIYCLLQIGTKLFQITILNRIWMWTFNINIKPHQQKTKLFKSFIAGQPYVDEILVWHQLERIDNIIQMVHKWLHLGGLIAGLRSNTVYPVVHLVDLMCPTTSTNEHCVERKLLEQIKDNPNPFRV